MKFALFLVLCLAFAFVVKSFEEEAVLEDEQGKESERNRKGIGAEAVNVLADEQSFDNEAVFEGDKEKESFEDVAVFEGDKEKESFEDEAVFEGDKEKESFKDEAVLAGELGKKSFEDEAVFADEQGKESFEDEAVLEDEQGNDKRRLGQKCKSHADCDRGECCGRFGQCVLKIGLFCRRKFCKTDADCDHLECCGLFGRCWPKPGPFCRPKPSCKTNADCLRGQCCFVRQCRPKRGLGKFCSPKSTCLLRCHDDLECRKSRYVYRCLVPLRPTPNTVVPTASG